MTPKRTKANIDGSNQSSITLEGSNLSVNGHLFFFDVPNNIKLTPSSFASADKSIFPTGCFVGFEATEFKSWHVASIGRLKNIKFMSIFRFKNWWSTHWVGSRGSDLEYETQILMLENSASGRPYVLLLPILEGPFRACLQPGSDDYVDLCVESGSTKTTAGTFQSVLYMHAGENPFRLVQEAIKVMRVHLKTFRLLEEKNPPGIIDKFGWCTWDAFYLSVHPEGVKKGVKGLVEGGCPPGLVLIDDGWQSVVHDDDPITKEGTNLHVPGEQMSYRLLKFQENYKFRDYGSPKKSSSSVPDKGMGTFVRDLKEEFKSVEYVYVWHAFCGYWGGLRPNVPGLPKSVVVKPELTPGLKKIMNDLAVDRILSTKVGLVPPEKANELYDGLHSHLKQVGIDGIKVDVIHILEMLCENYGGRVELAKKYYKALSSSLRKHFNGNGIISSMQQCNDFMFIGTETISLGRVGDDFWPSGDQNGTYWLQGCHMVHCAYNSLWMGNFIRPDWDMFQSVHPCAEFHAASRAISGGPVYVSDSVGEHNFELLKRIVLPDGTILRCQYYALPTRDSLFEDPLHDGKTTLKIWNLNKFTGVIGTFNCQGGGWSKESRRNQNFAEFSLRVTATTNPQNIEWNSGKYPISIKGTETFALFLYKHKKLVLSKPSQDLELSLEPFTFELITVSPVITMPGKSIQFAPIGLVNMLNSGGAIQSLAFKDEDKSVEIRVRGTGEMRIFASEKPKYCRIDGDHVAFDYQEQMVIIHVPWPDSGSCAIQYLF